ncbi:MAG: hypothetical protein JWR19_2925 [Pedosphaera sp.]|nr:hypothetical protein [Pedosphaera sp.]
MKKGCFFLRGERGKLAEFAQVVLRVEEETGGKIISGGVVGTGFSAGSSVLIEGGEVLCAEESSHDALQREITE